MQNTADLRAKWSQHGEQLVRECIRTNPGTRPPIWWLVEAPEPRRRRIGTMKITPGIDGDARASAGGCCGPKARFHRENYQFVEEPDAVHPFDSTERRTHVDRIAARPGAHPDFAADAVSLDRGVPAVLCVADDFAAVYESETDYLRRLGELTEAEIETLARQDALELQAAGVRPHDN